MKIKFGNKWYEVLDTRLSGCSEFYAIEDEENNIDWVANPDELIYDED